MIRHNTRHLVLDPVEVEGILLAHIEEKLGELLPSTKVVIMTSFGGFSVKFDVKEE